MAKVQLHPTIDEFRGAIGEIVFKRVRGKIIATRKPVFSKEQEPSAGQLTQRQKFREAAAYAKASQADPVLRPVYEPVARKREVAVYTVALRDHLNAPSIESFYLWFYKGQPGDRIAIRAKDDFGLAELEVRLTTPEGTPVEGGPAVEDGLHSGHWDYTATVAVAPGSTLRLEVTGADYAGNRVRAAEEITVGVLGHVDVKASALLPQQPEMNRQVLVPVQAEREEAIEEAVADPLPCAAETLAASQCDAANLNDAPCIPYVSEPAQAAARPESWEEKGEEEQPEVEPALCQTAPGGHVPAELMPLSLAEVPAEELAVPMIWWALLAAVRFRQGGADVCGLQVAGGAQDTPEAVRHPETLKKRALAPPEAVIWKRRNKR